MWNEDIETERIAANRRFESEYKDVTADPISYAAAKQIAVKKMAEWPHATPWEIANEAGIQVRKWKQSLQPPKPRAREDVIAEMRRSRGQAV